MVKRAKKWLAPKHASGFNSLTRGDMAFLDSARSIRNCRAHQSKSSCERMNDCLASEHLALNYSQFPRGAHLKEDIGAYLKSSTGATPRLIAYLDALDQLAKGLKVP